MADPQVFASRYEVVRQLGRGGMATVYLAHDRTLDRPVAVKVLFSELSGDPSFVERFRREAQAAAGLSHPNIVAVYDWGQEAGTYFIVMEYVEGQTLRDLLHTYGAFEPRRAAEIAAQVAAGLAFAHRRGVVHRDIKPGNVLITPQGHVKVADFGIARAGASDALTQTGSVMGTATYFSPEQAQGRSVDGRSDVYSLGVVLYEMCTGAPPFSGENPVSVAYQHVGEAIVPPSQRHASVPAPLEQVTMAALAKDPAHRYQSAEDLRADLLRFVRGEPVHGAALTAAVATVGDPSTVAATAATAVAGAPPTTRQPATAPPDDGGRKPWIAIVAALVVLALAGVAAYFLVSRSSSSNEAAPLVTVPDVTNQPVSQATSVLEAHRLKVLVNRVANPAAADTVLSQQPAANTQARQGSTVTLTVSSGPSSVTVPNVVGLPLEQAQAMLVNEGFQVSTPVQQASNKPAGTVLSQNPAGNTGAPSGAVVQLVVSSGSNTAAVPNVVGLDQATAANRLGQAGFVVNTVQQSSATVPAGNVMSTSPAGGTQAAKGSTVTMTVSSGAPSSSVPNVTGQTAAQATSTLQGQGFRVSQTSVPSPPGQLGKVVSQSPTSGTSVPSGSTVTISVGDGSQSTG